MLVAALGLGEQGSSIRCGRGEVVIFAESRYPDKATPTDDAKRKEKRSDCPAAAVVKLL